jgi:Protein tyrosine and serine/threonine kinase
MRQAHVAASTWHTVASIVCRIRVLASTLLVLPIDIMDTLQTPVVMSSARQCSLRMQHTAARGARKFFPWRQVLRAYSSIMADAASGVIIELCKFIYAAADAAKSHKKLSKQLKDRVDRLEKHLLRKAQRLPSFASEITKLLAAIHEFLKKREVKKVIKHFFTYKEITDSFAEFRARLNELVADSQFVEAEVAQADVLQDELDDFEAQQVINREMLDPSRAQAANKQLQSEAPREFTGFTEIDYDSLALGVELGSGSFGVVQRGTWSRMAVAVKVANCRSLDETTIKLLRRELRVHASPQVRHDRIVALYGACTVAPIFALVMEYAPSGTLYDLLHSSKDTHTQQRQSLSSAVRVQMLHDIAVAMQHLHRHTIVHGDVKTSNALVFEQQRVKICDFGLAAVNSSVSVSSRTAVHSRGTPAYMAPEVLNGSAITAASDVYSYSMLIYEVITETVPFAGTAVQVLHYQLAHQKRPDVSNAVVRSDCEKLRPLLQQCWQQAANKRPDFIHIVDDLNVLQGKPQQQQQMQQAAAQVSAF